MWQAQDGEWRPFTYPFDREHPPQPPWPPADDVSLNGVDAADDIGLDGGDAADDIGLDGGDPADDVSRDAGNADSSDEDRPTDGRL
jgi:hypothetical protein